MKNPVDKLSGSYYTPPKTVRFMLNYLKKERQLCDTVLEPAAGDGRFIDALACRDNLQRLTAVELSDDKVKRLETKQYPPSVELVSGDFISFSQQTAEKYRLIIGNPPYINRKNMDAASVERAELLCDRYKLSRSLMQNIWVAFLLASVSLLESDGAIFFVLPLEFLQVQYAEGIRLFLEKHFNSIHILSFKERMFPEIEQDACLVYLANKCRRSPYISFKVYERLDSAQTCYTSRIERNKPLKKWTNAVLSDEDIDLIAKLERKYKTINAMCDASPGIVTGANNTFILDEEQVQEYSCSEFVLPIISKSSMLGSHFLVTDAVIEDLQNKKKKVFLLNLSKTDWAKLPAALKSYITKAGEMENSDGIKLKDRYKCKDRTPWYGVPIVGRGDILFFKRYDRLPRIYVNEANIYTTDIAYNMRLLDDYDDKSLAFCFYNSLTLTLCEYNGRYYAGGVSELTPSEFKRLSIPYYLIEEKDIRHLSAMFSRGEKIEQIVRFVNSKTLSRDLTGQEIQRLDDIRKRLMERRLSSRDKVKV